MKHQILWLCAISCDCSLDSNQMCKTAQVASPKSTSKITSSIAIRWLTVQYCVITFSHAESDMLDFTTALPVDGKSKLIASILETLEEPIFRVKTNNDEEGILLVTITMCPSTKTIMIQGNFVQTWINEECPNLAAIVGKKTTYLDTVLFGMTTGLMIVILS